MTAESLTRHASGNLIFLPRGDPSKLTSEYHTASPPVSRSPSPDNTHDTLTLRALVNNKEAGVIIGKGGKNVADLREQTGVRAGVSKVSPGVHERVLTVSGSVEAVAKASPFGFLVNVAFMFCTLCFRHTTS